MSVFKERCLSDPQGVIKDLHRQTSRQAAEIHERGNKIKELEERLSLVLSLFKKVSPDEVFKSFEEEFQKRNNKKTNLKEKE